jgi:hypothetical protein
VCAHGVGGIGALVLAHGVGGIGALVFAHGVGGIGALVFASNHGVGGIGALVFAIRPSWWDVIAFSPIALVRTNNAKTTTTNHLDIDPSE